MGTSNIEEDGFHNLFRLACERQHMSEAEQSREGDRMLLLGPIIGHMKCVCTAEETILMTFISAGNKRTLHESPTLAKTTDSCSYNTQRPVHNTAL